MIGEIGAGLGSLKAAADILKGLNAAHTQAAINEVKISLQGHIFEAREALSAAQEAQATALGRVRELEMEIVQLKDWEAEKQRYQLEKLPPGILIRRLKPGMENGEPPHEICANCYNKDVKSLLHVTGQGNGRTHWKCHSCGFDERSGTFNAPAVSRNSGWAV